MSYVLQLCGWYPCTQDPFSGDFVQRHARALATQAPVVVLFAYKDLTRTSGGIQITTSRQSNLTEIIASYPRAPLFDTLFSQWRYLTVLWKTLPDLQREKGRPQVVHVHVAWKAAIWAAWIRFRYRWPLVVTEHSTAYHRGAPYFIGNAGWLQQRLVKSLFQKCLGMAMISEQLSQTIFRLYGNKTYGIVRNAVDINAFYPNQTARSGPFRLVHISTLNRQKNPEGLFRVLGALLHSGHALEVIIVGPLTPQLQAWQREHQAFAGQISCRGLIPYSEVAGVLREADALVLFSRYENLPCVILESHCCGVPVVSTRVGGIEEVVHAENGILVAEGDEAGLLQVLVDLVSGRRSFNREAIAREAREVYNYDHIGKDFMNIYRQLGIALPDDKTMITV